MIYARQLVKGERKELALLRHHPTETNFGAQLATRDPKEAAEACRMVQDAGVRFIDLNCGCPIHDAVKRGMGSRLLQKPNRLHELLKAMVQASQVPVTVKLRLGYSENKITIAETTRAAVEAGVAGITIHGRTREQRYSRAADWATIAEMAETCPVPVWGNGDVLTPFEAQQRLDKQAISGAMIARGALVKPWIFQELLEGREWLPSPEEQWDILLRFVEYLKEHFGHDELGQRRGCHFLSWHLDWFSRYRPLPEQDWYHASLEHPLLQTRILGEPQLKIPEKAEQQQREELAERMWEGKDPDALYRKLCSLARGVVSSGR